MPTVNCPQCGKSLEYEKLADLPYFPFCSKRCKLIDLGAWFDEEHRIAGSENPDDLTDDLPEE